MKILFDSTTLQFDEKIEREMEKVQATYGRLFQEQKQEVRDIEKRYNDLVTGKFKNLENFINEIALEQAKINEKYNGTSNEGFVNKSSLFPRSIENLSEGQKIEEEV